MNLNLQNWRAAYILIHIKNSNYNYFKFYSMVMQ